VDWALPDVDDGVEPCPKLLDVELLELLELLVLELLDLLVLVVLEVAEPGRAVATAPAAATLVNPTTAVATFSR